MASAARAAVCDDDRQCAGRAWGRDAVHDGDPDQRRDHTEQDRHEAAHRDRSGRRPGLLEVLHLFLLVLEPLLTLIRIGLLELTLQILRSPLRGLLRAIGGDIDDRGRCQNERHGSRLRERNRHEQNGDRQKQSAKVLLVELKGLGENDADGLGRPLQTVQVQGSAQGRDVVQPFVYDQFGREVTKYLPYALTGAAVSDGSYKTTALTDQPSFYNTPPAGVTQIGTPVAGTAFESSPLNRPVEQGAPGADWQRRDGRTVSPPSAA